MAQTFNNGDSNLSIRTKLNGNATELNNVTSALAGKADVADIEMAVNALRGGYTGTMQDLYDLITQGIPTPATPTNFVVNNVNKTADWTNVPGYTGINDYEYQINGGAITTATVKPFVVGAVDAGVGDVKVRVKAIPGVRNSSLWLTNPIPYTAGTIILVGTGSGNLTITQASTGAVNGDIILIAAGNYNNISINNFNLPEGERVYVKNAALVTISETMNMDNLAGVTVAGDYVNGLDRGFVFNNISYRAITLSTKFTRCTIESMAFNNVTDYTIIRDTSIRDVQYDGTALTRSDDIKFLNLDFDNATSIFWGGMLDNTDNKDTGFTRNFEMSGCRFLNSPDFGDFLRVENVEDYNIHHNTFSFLNADNDNHNGICLMVGNGEFHHNKLNEYHGNSIRARVYSRGLIPKKVKIYDNICANTRKYSGFEVQSFDYYITPGETTTAEVEVFHNTVYNMHYQDNSGTPGGNYFGVILDKYGMAGSTVDAWNNVGVHFLYPNGSNFLWGQNNPDNAYPNSNRYYATLADAGLTEDGTFVVEAGSPLLTGDYRENPYVINDFYGNPRIGRPTIGAVQYIP